MKQWKRVFLTLAVIIAFGEQLCLCGCGRKIDDRLLGSWDRKGFSGDTLETWTFMPDGKVKMGFGMGITGDVSYDYSAENGNLTIIRITVKGINGRNAVTEQKENYTYQFAKIDGEDGLIINSLDDNTQSVSEILFVKAS